MNWLPLNPQPSVPGLQSHVFVASTNSVYIIVVANVANISTYSLWGKKFWIESSLEDTPPAWLTELRPVVSFLTKALQRLYIDSICQAYCANMWVMELSQACLWIIGHMMNIKISFFCIFKLNMLLILDWDEENTPPRFSGQFTDLLEIWFFVNEIFETLYFTNIIETITYRLITLHTVAKPTQLQQGPQSFWQHFFC